MFENDPKNLAATLSEMERQSRLVTNFDQPAAQQKMAIWLGQDRRFDAFNKDMLVRRVQECRQSGATLDLDDPRLKGRPARPLDKRTE